ncbi:MAG: M23 family metallopeptidase [Elusimicrobia bacterium]|nr:M23 family metallopeptidase [Elusimicrobiota bacterium]
MRPALLLALVLSAPAAALEVRVDPAEAVPGDVLEASVLGAVEPRRVKLTYRGLEYALFPTPPDRLRAFIGLSAEAAAGTAPVRAVEPRRWRKDLAAEAVVTVASRTFTARKLTMPPERARLTSQPGAQDGAARIRAVAAVDTPVQRWEGPFRPPAEGRVSSAYGHPRTVNAQPWAWHKGVDIAAPVGSTVTAPNSGTVALAGTYPIQGGTVVIDHGQGLMSALFHLGELLVKTGDEVAASTPVARIGGSGFSTGAHVHWGVYVHGAAVDPAPLTRRRL